MRLLALVLCLVGCAATKPVTSTPLDNQECWSGGEFTYHSDESWDVTVRTDCAHRR